MIDEPPHAVAPAPPPAQTTASPVLVAEPREPTQPVPAPVPPQASAYQLPSETKADGTLVIDLKPLSPDPQTCLDENPDPFNPTILVCSKTEPDPRLGPVLGPTDEQVFGSAIPRARVKLSENAEAQANAIKKGVGGIDADGGEVRVKIGF